MYPLLLSLCWEEEWDHCLNDTVLKIAKVQTSKDLLYSDHLPCSCPLSSGVASEGRCSVKDHKKWVRRRAAEIRLLLWAKFNVPHELKPNQNFSPTLSMANDNLNNAVKYSTKIKLSVDYALYIETIYLTTEMQSLWGVECGSYLSVYSNTSWKFRIGNKEDDPIQLNLAETLDKQNSPNSNLAWARSLKLRLFLLHKEPLAS